MVTKVEAIKKVMEDNGGTATWDIIYSNIQKYYPAAKEAKEWQAALRGVLYRELKNNRNFKKVGFAIFALREYEEEKIETITKKDRSRMHSYIEGICLELGNFERALYTYTPDVTAIFKDNISLGNLRTLTNVPPFTYEEIIDVTKRIDVLWFNKSGYQFPRRAFEVVDSPSTLGEALNRTYQLKEFNVDFCIIGKEINRKKYDDKVSREPYVLLLKRYKYINYEEIIKYYETKLEEIKRSVFK